MSSDALAADPIATPEFEHAEKRRALRDTLIVTLGGQLERTLGTLTVLALRWGLDPARLGVYTGLRLYLDNTNRSSLGVGLGAVQEIPILRAAGREAEARLVADVAHTTNTITCLIYAAALLVWAWLRAPLLKGDPLAAEWTWGLVAVAGLTLLKRYESFLIAVLRARREFALTTELDVFESLVSAASVGFGLWVAGFWGLLAAVGVILGSKIVYLQRRNPLRFAWRWDSIAVARLMRQGLPILANTAVFGMVLNLDRVVILWRLADPERMAGLYTIALMGTSWSYDAAGRIVTVAYTYFQTTLGRTNDPREVARLAMLATEAQAPVLFFGSAVAALAGPTFLGALMPKYVDGLPALRPLLIGMTLLGLAWPARQLLITVGRPYRLALATLAGLAVTAAAGIVGADASGLVGVAWGMSVGYGSVFLLTSAAAFAGSSGAPAWTRHLARLMSLGAWIGLGAALALSTGSIGGSRWTTMAARIALLAVWSLPALWTWSARLGVFDLWRRSRAAHS